MQNAVLQQRLHPDRITACVLQMCEPVPTLLLGGLRALVRQQSCVQPPLLPFHIGSSTERFRHADGIRIAASLKRRTTHPQRLQEHVPHTLRHVHRRQPGIDEELVEGGEELPCSRCNISHRLQALTEEINSNRGPVHIVRHTASEAPLRVQVSVSVEGGKLVPRVLVAIERVSPGQAAIGVVRRAREFKTLEGSLCSRDARNGSMSESASSSMGRSWLGRVTAAIRSGGCMAGVAEVVSMRASAAVGRWAFAEGGVGTWSVGSSWSIGTSCGGRAAAAKKSGGGRAEGMGVGSMRASAAVGRSGTFATDTVETRGSWSGGRSRRGHAVRGRCRGGHTAEASEAVSMRASAAVGSGTGVTKGGVRREEDSAGAVTGKSPRAAAAGVVSISRRPVAAFLAGV